MCPLSKFILSATWRDHFFFSSSSLSKAHHTQQFSAILIHVYREAPRGVYDVQKENRMENIFTFFFITAQHVVFVFSTRRTTISQTKERENWICDKMKTITASKLHVKASECVMQGTTIENDCGNEDRARKEKRQNDRTSINFYFATFALALFYIFGCFCSYFGGTGGLCVVRYVFIVIDMSAYRVPRFQ